MTVALVAASVAPALAQEPPLPPAVTGGSQYPGDGGPLYRPTVPGLEARIVNGLAAAPELAPPAVQEAIWAANEIVGKPYVYGGGHRAFAASGYDCSGTVSFSLHGGNLLTQPMDSRELMRYGAAGPGAWITIYSNRGHAYTVIAGVRLDTSAADDPAGGKGPKWRPLRKSNRGYRVRHPVGF